MIVAIQQPEHLPWLGFFHKMLSVDEFIYLDNVQFKKRYFENRNKIRTNNKPGFEWITVPVKSKGRFIQKINEVEIDYAMDWQRKYLNKLKQNYNKAEYFERVFPEIEHIIKNSYKKLVELNISLINCVRNYLDIKTPVIFASDICNGKGSELILELCVRKKANTYLSGPDGRNYLKLEDFFRNNIEIKYHDYQHPVYKQLQGSFISHSSIIDLLFNYGKGSVKIIK